MGPIEQEQLTVQGKGLVAAGATAAAGSIAWIDQASAYVDLAAGVIACIAGSLTIAWYITRFIKLRGGANDKTNSRKQA